MTAKRWFYVMLSLPIAVPVLLGLISHIIYISFPHEGYNWSIENGMLHRNSPKISSTVSVGETWIDIALTYLLAATNVLGPLQIISMFIHIYAKPYLMFLLAFVMWSWRRPFEDIRRIIWRLPLLAYPFLVIWMIIESHSPGIYRLVTPLMAQIIVFPIYCIFAYAYVFLAWRLVPKQYRIKS